MLNHTTQKISQLRPHIQHRHERITQLDDIKPVKILFCQQYSK